MSTPSNQLVPELSKDELLKSFMEEFFDFAMLKKVGFYGREIKKRDYKAQADRVCKHFGYKTVYEYGAKEVRGHITDDNKPYGTPFTFVIPSIYE